MVDIKVNKKVLVKSVSAVILVCVIAAAIIGLGLLFGLFKFSDPVANILLSLLTVFIAGLFLLNSINAVTSGNKVGIFAAFMIIVSAILFLLLIWAGSLGEIFNYIIVIVSMVSILLNLIIGHYILLRRSLVVVQIFLYLNFAYVELVLAFVILGNSSLIDVWQIFVMAIIVALTLYIVLKVKEKNIAQKETETKLKENGDEFVTITKQEYEELKAAAEKLKELTANSAPADENE